ncbi:MAG: D-TA family PLP-dependent enzyme [Oceanospirillaceae bacterium]|nr:D-TA family PLP-dependent enzyme [Oceanospirillaceae bacterium]
MSELTDLALLDTPCVIVDEQVVDKNIQRFQQYCNSQTFSLRPHIKTHKIPALAHRQLQGGAIGINCQKISEAEVFADAGISDILITFNILGKTKLARLVALSKRVKLTVVADNEETVRQLSACFLAHESCLSVLVECDTGAKRCGVQSPKAAQQLAAFIDSADGVEFTGLMTYPPVNQAREVNLWLKEARQLCEQKGLTVKVISSGGTPSMYQAAQYSEATEYRVGTYIYNDKSLVERGDCEYKDCALTVLATVVSCPTADRVVIDAGSKALTSDLLGMQGHGWVREYPAAVIYGLSEEHGCIDFSQCETRPAVGDKLNIVPNHVCVVSNLFDFVYFLQADNRLKKVAVAARGKVC